MFFARIVSTVVTDLSEAKDLESVVAHMVSIGRYTQAEVDALEGTPEYWQEVPNGYKNGGTVVGDVYTDPVVTPPAKSPVRFTPTNFMLYAATVLPSTGTIVDVFDEMAASSSSDTRFAFRVFEMSNTLEKGETTTLFSLVEVDPEVPTFTTSIKNTLLDNWPEE